MIALIMLAAVLSDAREPIPLNRDKWFGAGDYPREAAERLIGGRVSVSLQIDRRGVAHQCTVKESSGTPLLDNTTCALLLARAKFTPAVDDQGVPRDGSYATSATWQAAQVAPPHSMRSWVSADAYPAIALRNGWQGTTYFNVAIGVDGRATDCVITQSSGHKHLDDAACIAILRRARFHPAINENGAYVEAHFNDAVTWRIPR